MASTLPTNIAVSTTGHPGLHNAVNAAVNEHDGRISSLETRATALESVATIVGAGRPDVPASMTTAVQAAVSNAPVGATFTSTDGASVKAWAWQKIPTGWKVTFGDTEWREIGPLLTASVATSVVSFRICRTTDALRIQSKGLVTASGVGFYSLPTGFRSSAILFQPLTTDKPGSMLGISDSLWASSAFSQHSATYQDLAAKCVDPWPTSLPGTAS